MGVLQLQICAGFTDVFWYFKNTVVIDNRNRIADIVITIRSLRRDLLHYDLRGILKKRPYRKIRLKWW